MSIADNKSEYLKALEKAHVDFPLEKEKFKNTPNNCNHNFNKVVYCDGGDWDIIRCVKCGKEKVVRCSFDEEYD